MGATLIWFWGTQFALIGTAIVACVGWLQARRHNRWMQETLQRERDKLLRRVLELEPRAHELDWLLWWVRNAVECSEADQTRASLVRFALAAALEPGLDFGEHAARLHRLAEDPATPAQEQDAARCFAVEWAHYQETKEPPWEHWQRTSGKPRWNPHAQRRWYAAALRSWDALLPPRPPQLPADPPERSERH